MVDLDNGGKGVGMVDIEKSRNADDLKNGRNLLDFETSRTGKFRK